MCNEIAKKGKKKQKLFSKSVSRSSITNPAKHCDIKGKKKKIPVFASLYTELLLYLKVQ